MSNVHALFKQVPDTPAAEAFSELMPGMGQFRVTSLVSPEQLEDVGNSTEFPPIPCYMSEVSIAYVDDTGLTRRKFADIHLGVAGIDHTASRADHIRAATALDGLKQSFDDSSTEPEIEQYHAELVGRVRALGLRTIAALVTYSSPTTGEHFSGLVAPKRLSRDIPLELREVFLAGRAQGLITDSAESETGRVINAFIRNEPETEIVSTYLLARSLPTLAIIKRAMELTPLQALTLAKLDESRFAGMTRTERRKLQAQERRNNRRRQS